MRRRVVLVLAACLLGTACSSDPEPSRTSGSGRTTEPSAPAATPAPARTPSPAASPQAAAPFEADTSRDVGRASGGPLTVVAVRAAQQDGYDRVVFELAGERPGQPGWRVEYEDDPRQDGSGNPVEVAGEATLVVRIDGAGYPYDTGQEEARTASGPGDTRVVEEVRLGSVYEGVYEAFIGVTARKPFRVTRLSDPARVVVDVRHD